ncbi:MAG: FtsX-like permease family protein, partial [Bacteroidota bacterium]
TGFLYWENTHDQLTVRLSSDLKNSLDRVQELWSEYSDMPMDYQFLDSEFDKLFKREQQLGKVIGSFTFLAFFVACLGILGLAGHTAEQKTKEIGIRKALGATVEQIVLMFSKRFTLLVLIATLLSAPLAYSITNYWLESFAYKIALSPTPFIMASLLGLFLVTLTVSYHLIKAARANPVLALKDE